MLVPALVCAALAGLGGFLVPRLVAAVPEPEPDPEEEQSAALPAADKALYADIARTPYLAVGSALVGTVAGALVGWSLGWVWPLVYLVPAIPLGTALAVIDWRTFRLPTWYLAPAYPVLVVLVAGSAVLTRDWADLGRAGLGWLAMGGVYAVSYLLSTSFGYGDVRLAGLLGIGLGYLGWPELVVGGFLAFPLFGAPPLVLAVVRRDAGVLRRRMPFGPAMLVSALLGIAAGPAVADWYLRSAGLS